jgi:hypothetical protein
LSRLGICGRNPSTEIAAPAKWGSPHHWQSLEVHTGPRYACSIPNSVHLQLHNKVMQKTSRNHSQS